VLTGRPLKKPPLCEIAQTRQPNLVNLRALPADHFGCDWTGPKRKAPSEGARGLDRTTPEGGEGVVPAKHLSGGDRRSPRRSYIGYQGPQKFDSGQSDQNVAFGPFTNLDLGIGLTYLSRRFETIGNVALSPPGSPPANKSGKSPEVPAPSLVPPQGSPFL
jgi:hypothetical protein